MSDPSTTTETVRSIVLLPKGAPTDEAARLLAEESMDRTVAQRPGCRRTSPARYIGPATSAHGITGIAFEADTETENLR